MQHIHQLVDARLNNPSIVAVGMFDGVHRGHQYLIKQLVEQAHSSNRAAVVLSFFPHPDIVIRGINEPYYLSSPEERAQLLGALGVDLVVTHPFNAEVRQIRATEFVESLHAYLKLSALWASEDFALGYKREGNIEFLRQKGQTMGFVVETIQPLTDSAHTNISSAGIRKALMAGNIDQANDWLGRPYAVSGEVVHGEKRGRTIGFPTANIAYWEQQILPQIGVYAGWASLGDERWMAVTNVGKRPTFNGEGITVECHLLDFDRDIYGENLRFEFVKHLRGEMKFNGIEALIAQIRQDAVQGRQILSEISK